MLLLACGFSFAQTTIPQVGQVVVPDYIWTIASLAIGWLVKEISSPLTALLKPVSASRAAPRSTSTCC